MLFGFLLSIFSVSLDLQRQYIYKIGRFHDSILSNVNMCVEDGQAQK